MNSQIIQVKGEVSSYIWPLFSMKQYYRVDSVFRQGFNLDRQSDLKNERLIYVSGPVKDDISVLGVQIYSGISSEELIAKINVGDRVHCDQNHWTFYNRNQSFRIIFEEVNCIDLSMERCSTGCEFNFGNEMNTLIETMNCYESSAFSQLDSLNENYQEWQIMMNQPKKFSDQAKLSQLIYDLVGKGIGLTPSGDDFIQGMMIMEKGLMNHLPRRAKIFEKIPSIRRIVVDVIETRSTTRVSKSYYDALLSDFANLSWLDLVNSLIHKDFSNVMDAVQRIQHYGQTSGKDMLLGAYVYLKILQKWEELYG